MALRGQRAANEDGETELAGTGADVTVDGASWMVPSGTDAGTAGAAHELAGAVRYPSGGSALDVGCGWGAVAVTAALRGCGRVTATDPDPLAIAMTRQNAVRRGVAERMRLVAANELSALEAGDRYDLVFWHVSRLDGCEAFLRDVRWHLATAGRVIVGLSGSGRGVLERRARRFGWQLERYSPADSLFMLDDHG